MPGPFVHRIDPIIGTVSDVHLWWYGAAYSAGFLVLFFFLRARRGELGLSTRQVYDLTLLGALGTLAGARLVEVAFYEWAFYRDHLGLVPAVWLGGMSTHGVLVGGIGAVWLFARLHGVPFLRLADALAVPVAFILGVGRIGNFIDGQIVGAPTDVGWAVKFPDAEGFRHPVTFYDGLKNFLLIPVLLYARRRQPPPGTVAAQFIFLYAFLRIGIDLFREYPGTLAGIATGQALNVAMAIGGLGLLLWCRTRLAGARAGDGDPTVSPGAGAPAGAIAWRRAALTALVLLPLIIPSDWTQDVPARYGKRHAGLQHSTLYPPIAVPASGPGSAP